MMAGDSSRESLTKLLNASGFAFQLAVEDAAAKVGGDFPWKVTRREHPWKTDLGDGFIDLVLTRGAVNLAVECKRTRDGMWVFIVSNDGDVSRSHAKICWANTAPHRKPLSDWGDIQIYPTSPESDFCVVRGSGERDSPMLERLGSLVAESATGLASDILTIREGYDRTEIIVPVVVTSARLFVTRLDPTRVDLATGDAADLEFIEVPHVRFRKSLSLQRSDDFIEPERIADLAYGSERTIFIVNSLHLAEWLRAFQVNSDSAPWFSARARANAGG
jgi:hypothetical protein